MGTHYNLVRTGRSNVSPKRQTFIYEGLLTACLKTAHANPRACVFGVCERQRERERERDDDEHDDDAVGGCQGVLEYRHRSVT